MKVKLLVTRMEASKVVRSSQQPTKTRFARTRMVNDEDTRPTKRPRGKCKRRAKIRPSSTHLTTKKGDSVGKTFLEDVINFIEHTLEDVAAIDDAFVVTRLDKCIEFGLEGSVSIKGLSYGEPEKTFTKYGPLRKHVIRMLA